MEPSDRAPKRFEKEIPEPRSEEQEVGPFARQWAECLLSITNVSMLYPIPNDQHPVVRRLWTSAQMPPSTKAVCEVSMELQTGRTHQIRGQLSEIGFPLVGDEQYGGAIPANTTGMTTQRLALQSNYIGFWEPDYQMTQKRKKGRNVVLGKPSNRWTEHSIDEAWWSSILAQEGLDESSFL